MSGHAPLAPSAAHRWMACPGSVRLIGDKESPDTVFAREGTFAHLQAARCLQLGTQAASRLGETDGEFTVDDAMAGHLQAYLDVVRRIELLEEGELEVEVAVVLVEGLVYGTADAIIWSSDRKRVHVVDLKYGAGVPVSAHDNEQLTIYGLAAVGAKIPDHWTTPTEEIHLHIVQPRRPDADGNAHRTAVLDRAQALAAHLELGRAAEAAGKPDAPLAAGDHCRFCPAAATCPALLEDAIAIARDVFPTASVDHPVTPPHPSALSVDQLGKLLASADVVESWLRAVRAHALERAVDVKIPGWKLVDKIGNRKWANDADAAAKLQALGIDPWAPREICSPAQIEKRGGRAIKPTVETLTVRAVTGVALVPDSDKRPATNPAAIFLQDPLQDAE